MNEIVEKLFIIIELQTELIRKLYNLSAQNDELDAELARIEKLRKEMES